MKVYVAFQGNRGHEAICEDCETFVGVADSLQRAQEIAQRWAERPDWYSVYEAELWLGPQTSVPPQPRLVWRQPA